MHDNHPGMPRRGVLAATSMATVVGLACHFAWPGIGHVAKFGDGFRYLPAPMDMMTVKG